MPNIGLKHILGLAKPETAQTGMDVLKRVLGGVGGGAAGGAIGAGGGTAIGSLVNEARYRQTLGNALNDLFLGFTTGGGVGLAGGAVGGERLANATINRGIRKEIFEKRMKGLAALLGAGGAAAALSHGTEKQSSLMMESRSLHPSTDSIMISLRFK